MTHFIAILTWLQWYRSKHIISVRHVWNLFPNFHASCSYQLVVILGYLFTLTNEQLGVWVLIAHYVCHTLTDVKLSANGEHCFRSCVIFSFIFIFSFVSLPSLGVVSSHINQYLTESYSRSTSTDLQRTFQAIFLSSAPVS